MCMFVFAKEAALKKQKKCMFSAPAVTLMKRRTANNMVGVLDSTTKNKQPPMSEASSNICGWGHHTETPHMMKRLNSAVCVFTLRLCMQGIFRYSFVVDLLYNISNQTEVWTVSLNEWMYLWSFLFCLQTFRHTWSKVDGGKTTFILFFFSPSNPPTGTAVLHLSFSLSAAVVVFSCPGL